MSNDEPYMASKLEALGSELTGDIVHLLRKSGTSDSCYAFKLRVKTETRLLEKVIRKRQETSGYSLHRVTDVVGLRLVALFKLDMVDLFTRVIEATKHLVAVQPNPFEKDSCSEIIVYTGDTIDHEITLKIKDIASTRYPGVAVVEKASHEGYSSIHLVARLDKIVECMSTESEKHLVPIEIQIRTVFEDAWGEIDHRYGYVIRTGKEAGSRISNPETIQKHLRVLKKFADGCVEYSECIRRDALSKVVAPVAAQAIIPVESDDDIVVRLRNLDVPSILIDRYIDLRKEKDETVVKNAAGSPVDTNWWVTLAENFRELAEDASVFKGHEDESNSEGLQLIYYYIKMNEALCLIYINETEYVALAEDVYEELHAIFPDFPFLTMRIGQALSKLGRIDEAIDALRQSGESACQIAKDAQEGGGQWPDRLPKIDYEHLQRSQPKLLGYALWQKAASINSDEHEPKCQLFKEAYEITAACLKAPGGNVDYCLTIHNNLLYYATAFLSHSKKLPRGHTFQRNPLEMKNHIEFLREQIGRGKKVTADVLDTMYRGYAALGNLHDAQKAAVAFIDACLSSDDGGIADASRIKLMRAAKIFIDTGNVSAID